MAIAHYTPPSNYNPPANYLPPPAYSVPVTTGTVAASTPCCNNNWLYMIIAALVGGIVGYAINHEHVIENLSK